MSESMPTIYASLPLELRQHILHYSFYEPCTHDKGLNINLAISHKVYCPTLLTSQYLSTNNRQLIPAPYTHTWARTLQTTHPNVDNDLIFVLKQALQRIEAECGPIMTMRSAWNTMTGSLGNSGTRCG